jgi:TnpA family transposase
MSAIERTTYPRFPKRRRLKQQELNRGYSVSQDDFKIIKLYANTDKSRLNLAIQLKTFQVLGYFISLDQVPDEVISHIRQSLKYHYRLSYGYSENNKSLYRHRDRIRTHLQVKRWGWGSKEGKKINLGMRAALESAFTASHLMNNISDITNATIEGLLQSNYELPSFYRLNRLVRHTRHMVNNTIFENMHNALIKNGKTRGLDQLLNQKIGLQRTAFNDIKSAPKRPTIKNFNNYLEYYEWLNSLGDFSEYFNGVAKIKIDQFAQEAYDFTADEIRDLLAPRRYTLLMSMIYKSQSNSKDSIARMLCRLISNSHKNARSKLRSSLDNSKEETCDVAELFQQVIDDGRSIKNYCQFAKSFFNRINLAGGLDEVHNKCTNVLISHGKDHRIFLSDMIQKRRSLLLKILKSLELQSSNQNDKLISAIKYLLDNSHKRSKHLPGDVDLSFATDNWKNKIISTKKNGKIKYRRKELESCILEYASKGLNSGDLFVDGANTYSDYRAKLTSWGDCKNHLDDMCEQVGIDNNAEAMFANLKASMITKSQVLDDCYVDQNSFIINPDNGRPVLKKYEAKVKSEHAEKIENLIRERMPERTLFDIIINAHKNVAWADDFGLKSGTEDKLKDPIAKYIITVFCYATSLGPTQTSKHVRYKINAKTIYRLNKKHVSVKILENATNRVINCLNQFPLLQAWGTGKRCAVDGTFEDIHDDNLIAEQHIRYGKKGGVAYRHIADNYIALFSTFIQSGTWEAIHIIDGLLKNASELQPNIVHGDTQSQSLPVFAFAYLLGIELMPRIRNWKDLNLYKADKNIAYDNIDPLFCDAEIDWELLKTHWQDLMQVIISVKLGKVSSSFMLSKLNSYNNQNTLYKAFKELGKVIRTNFLLDYISDMDLRQMITATTNKIESYHKLEDWIRFGSTQLTTSNNPDEMDKAIKYNDLVANCIMLQNVIDISSICHDLRKEGYKITEEDLSHMSPYMTEHLKRFGEYVVNLNRRPDNLYKIRDRRLFEKRSDPIAHVS